jgi:hypothetical protein
MEDVPLGLDPRVPDGRRGGSSGGGERRRENDHQDEG